MIKEKLLSAASRVEQFMRNHVLSRRGLIAASTIGSGALVSEVCAQEPGIITLGGPPSVVFQTLATAAASQISPSVHAIHTLGYRTPGVGGARYVRANSRPAHALWFRSADGAYWSWSDTRLYVEMAGAYGDGVYDQATGAIVSGTDDRQAIQNAIDAHCWFGIADACYFSNRTYLISGPLYAHYATSAIVQCRLYGEWNYRANSLPHGGSSGLAQKTSPGTTIFCNFNQGMGISIGGNYGGHVKGIALVGANAPWILRNKLVYGTPPEIDDTVVGNWIDPSLPAAASNRYSPLCGIAVDAYLGTPNYPMVSYPSYLHGSKPTFASSNVTIEDVYIGGFVVGIASSPGGALATSDFLKIRNCLIERCAYGISESANNQRNLLRENIFYSITHTCETTNTFGAQIGTLGPSINCTYGGGIIQMFDLASTWHGVPLIYIGAYGEQMWRIGTIRAETAIESSIVFDACEFSMDLQNNSRGYPATIVDGYTPGAPIHVTFRESNIFGYASVCPILFGQECLTLDGYYNRSNNGAGPGGNYAGVGNRAYAYQRFASNVTADGLITFDGFSRTGRITGLKFTQYNIDAETPNATNVTNIICGPIQPSDRSHPACAYVQRIVESTTPHGEGVFLPNQVSLLDKSAIREASLSNGELKFALPAAWRTAYSLAYRGPLPGDVIIDQLTGSTFFVHSETFASGVVVATLQNNYKIRRRIREVLTPINLSAGNFAIVNSRLFTTSQYLQGDLQVGSPDVKNCGDASGNNDFITTDLVNGDYYYVDPARDLPVSQPDSIISAVAAGSFSFAGAANYFSRRRFGVFIRQGPANS